MNIFIYGIESKEMTDFEQRWGKCDNVSSSRDLFFRIVGVQCFVMVLTLLCTQPHFILYKKDKLSHPQISYLALIATILFTHASTWILYKSLMGQWISERFTISSA